MKELLKFIVSTDERDKMEEFVDNVFFETIQEFSKFEKEDQTLQLNKLIERINNERAADPQTKRIDAIYKLVTGRELEDHKKLQKFIKDKYALLYKPKD